MPGAGTSGEILGEKFGSGEKPDPWALDRKYDDISTCFLPGTLRKLVLGPVVEDLKRRGTSAKDSDPVIRD